MKKPNFPGIAGFECYPEGKLLAQVVDFDREVGFAYERCIGYAKPPHTHDRVTVTFARGASRSEIKVYPEARSFRLDASSVHWMAKDKEHEQNSFSTVYDTFALFPTEGEVRRIAASFGIGREELKAALVATTKVKRGALVADALDRYFFHRVVGRLPDDAVLAALERDILGTVLTAVVGRDARKPSKFDAGAGPGEGEGDGDLVRALELIESKLFEDLTIEQVCAAARTSQATLFRRFRDSLRTTPFAYIRGRRLDEALALLETGKYLVGDAALLVGYEDLSAFSKAFKERFRNPPSAVIPRQRQAQKY